MKKVLAVILAVAMVLALGVTASAAAAPEAKVGVFWYAFSDAYLSTVRAALDADLEEAGIEFQNFDANNSDKYQLDPNGVWSADAFDFMSVNLAGYSEANGNMIELIIANNDDMAIGSISALQSAGYNLGKDEECTKIPVFGVDATQVAQDAIKDDTMTGTVKQDAEGMAAAICGVVNAVAQGTPIEEALAEVADSDEIFSIAEGFTNKLFVAYAPFTGAEEAEEE